MKAQKHLGLKLDEKLNFREHLKFKFAIANKGIEMMKKLNMYLPRHLLVTLYKAFIQPYLDYADIIYYKPSNRNICNTIENLQHNAVLVTTGDITWLPKEKFYQNWVLNM